MLKVFCENISMYYKIFFYKIPFLKYFVIKVWYFVVDFKERISIQWPLRSLDIVQRPFITFSKWISHLFHIYNFVWKSLKVTERIMNRLIRLRLELRPGTELQRSLELHQQYVRPSWNFQRFFIKKELLIFLFKLNLGIKTHVWSGY